MAQSLAEEPRQRDSSDLATRLDAYRRAVERVVKEVGEHPQYELKTSCLLQTLSQKIELVKDIQSIATSRIESEKYLIIGADEINRSFVPVANIADFDDATIRQLLAKYLTRVPEFELFTTRTSAGNDFVLFVFPRQANRRVLAKSTVYDDRTSPPKLLLREGDLWTKGSSTAKRLATPEDWDEIFEELIEREAEHRATQRTSHLLERVVAQERIRSVSGLHTVPTFTTDEEFVALLEELTSAGDTSRFRLVIERLRDDAVEAWHTLGAYDSAPERLSSSAETLPAFAESVRSHKNNVFMPALRKLTVAGILVIKNKGPVEFLELVMDLLEEVFGTSHQLRMLRIAFETEQTLRQFQPQTQPLEHFSHTVPALESLIAIHLIGAYIFKRARFDYFRSLFRPRVHLAGPEPREGSMRTPMCFWPLYAGRGEPEQLGHRGGRINLCADRVAANGTYLKLFGSKPVVTDSLCQYEFCLELNSFLCVSSKVPEISTYLKQNYPDLVFNFWPCLIAFRFDPVMPLAQTIYNGIVSGAAEPLVPFVFDSWLANRLVGRDRGGRIYGRFLRDLASDQSELFLQQHRFPPIRDWPSELKELIHSIPPDH
ncbi:MAG TPA: hypothetical protein VMT20_29980 [Terriglobia bacterium]|nr:hypothetical protein [Terriglobia bacterium]